MRSDTGRRDCVELLVHARRELRTVGRVHDLQSRTRRRPFRHCVLRRELRSRRVRADDRSELPSGAVRRALVETREAEGLTGLHEGRHGLVAETLVDRAVRRRDNHLGPHVGGREPVCGATGVPSAGTSKENAPSLRIGERRVSRRSGGGRRVVERAEHAEHRRSQLRGRRLRRGDAVEHAAVTVHHTEDAGPAGSALPGERHGRGRTMARLAGTMHRTDRGMRENRPQRRRRVANAFVGRHRRRGEERPHHHRRVMLRVGDDGRGAIRYGDRPALRRLDAEAVFVVMLDPSGRVDGTNGRGRTTPRVEDVDGCAPLPLPPHAAATATSNATAVEGARARRHVCVPVETAAPATRDSTPATVVAGGVAPNTPRLGGIARIRHCRNVACRTAPGLQRVRSMRR